jgi:Holliday junction resolvase RusA-like endonuclease
MVLKLTLPIPPSINSSHFLNRRLKPETKKWMSTARTIATWECLKQKWKKTSKEKIVLEIRLYWGSNRIQDCSNRVKVLEDSLQGVVFENDNMLLTRVMDFGVDAEKPRVELVIYKFEIANKTLDSSPPSMI